MSSARTQACVRRALAEDLGSDELAVASDVTTALALADAGERRGRARLFAKSHGVLAGRDCAVAAFRALDPDCGVELLRADGDAFAPGDDVLLAEGAMADGGCIINISSMTGLVANPPNVYYSSTKFALEALTEGLAKEVAPFGIHVSAVEPGAIRTDWSTRSRIQFIFWKSAISAARPGSSPSPAPTAKPRPAACWRGSWSRPGSSPASWSAA